MKIRAIKLLASGLFCSVSCYVIADNLLFIYNVKAVNDSMSNIKPLPPSDKPSDPALVAPRTVVTLTHLQLCTDLDKAYQLHDKGTMERYLDRLGDKRFNEYFGAVKSSCNWHLQQFNASVNRTKARGSGR